MESKTKHPLLFLLLLLWLVHLSISTSTEVEIPIAVMLPSPETENNCTRAAIEMALHDVNSLKDFIAYTDSNSNHTEVYKFKSIFTYTSTSAAESIEALHSSFKKANIFATIGPPFNEQVEYCTEYTTANANNHISYSEANEPIERYFVMYHQTPPSIAASFSTVAYLLKTYNWTRTGIVYDYSEKRYRKNADKIRGILKHGVEGQQEIDILSEQGIWSIPAEYSVSKELGNLQEKGVRIIIALTGVRGARKIFCEAFKRKMYRPKVVWILFQFLPEDWATDKYNSYETSSGFKREIDCTEEQLHAAADGYISITKKAIRDDTKKTVSSMDAKQFKTRLHDQVGHEVMCNDKVAYAYDSVWLLALGAKKVALTRNLSTYNHMNYELSMNMAHQIKQTSFEGLTGYLTYIDRFSSWPRIGFTSAWVNRRKTGPQHFADYKAYFGKFEMLPNANQLVFGPSGKIPQDRATYDISFDEFDHSILVIMWFFAIAGISLALIFIGAMLYLLKTRGDCFETPIIDCIVVFGSIFCYLSVIIYGLDTRYITRDNIPDICTTFMWLFSIGFTLVFGGLFSKMWRMYKQYMTPDVKVVDNSNRKNEQDVPEWVLLIVIGVFIIGDVVILTVWTKYAPFEEDIFNITEQVSQFADVIHIKQVIRCSCDRQTHFTIGIYCYKGLLLIFGIFLAWQTRHAKFKVKNDSKQIAMAIYNIVVISVIGIVCVTVLASTRKHQALFLIVAVCIIICTTTTLLLGFLQKIRRLLSTPVTKTTTGKINKGSDTPTGKYTLEYMRKPISITTEKTQRQLSNVTSQTDVSTGDGSPPQALHLTKLKSDGSVVSVDQAYLSGSTPISKTPVSKLDSGIYVGATSEDDDAFSSPDVVQETADDYAGAESGDVELTVETTIEFEPPTD